MLALLLQSSRCRRWCVSLRSCVCDRGTPGHKLNKLFASRSPSLNMSVLTCGERINVNQSHSSVLSLSSLQLGIFRIWAPSSMLWTCFSFWRECNEVWVKLQPHLRSSLTPSPDVPTVLSLISGGRVVRQRCFRWCLLLFPCKGVLAVVYDVSKW